MQHLHDAILTLDGQTLPDHWQKIWIFACDLRHETCQQGCNSAYLTLFLSIILDIFRLPLSTKTNIQSGGILLTTNHDYDHTYTYDTIGTYIMQHIVYEYVHKEQQQQQSISKICIITSHLDTKQKIDTGRIRTSAG